MSSHLDPKPALELLERLGATIRDFATREEQLERGYRDSQNRRQTQLESALAEEEQRLAEATVTTEASFAAGVKRVHARRDSRGGRIQANAKARLQRGLDDIEKQAGQRIFAIQRDLLQNDKNREEYLKNAAATCDQYHGDLATANAALAAAEANAQKGLAGFGSFQKLILNPPEGPAADLASDEYQLTEQANQLMTQAETEAGSLRRSPLIALFRILPLWLWVVVLALGGGAMVLFPPHFGSVKLTYQQAGGILGGILVFVVMLHLIGRSQANARVTAVARGFGQARKLLAPCSEKSVARRDSEIARIHREHAERAQLLRDTWNQTKDAADEARVDWHRTIDDKVSIARARNDRLGRLAESRLKAERDAAVAAARDQISGRRGGLQSDHQQGKSHAEVTRANNWQQLTTAWTDAVRPPLAAIAAARSDADAGFPPWTPALAEAWTPPRTFSHLTRFASFEVDVATLAGNSPRDPRMALPGPVQLSVPVLLRYPDQGCVLFETRETGRDRVMAALNNIVLRLLADAPPGKLSFTIIDPVELGQSFAGLMHLADFAERLINSRIWTQTGQIEERLAFLNEHIEKVTQMYLRNEFQTITQYNEKAGRIAEKYHFLVIADFPVNFSETAVRRLMSIAASGPRCGVYTLIHWDQRRPIPPELVADELRRNSLVIRSRSEGFTLGDQVVPGVKLVLDTPPSPEISTVLLQKVGRSSVDADRVEMPFEEIAPKAGEMWSLETTTELRVAIGRTGATKQQFLALGKGTRQHALMAGKTGSGKSTLFHVIITNLALWSRPDQIEFYLIDFKKGVEFKCYASSRLPHAKVVAIESDREFALSVLQRLDEELRRRGDLFRELGVQDLPGYRAAGGKSRMPRTLLLIDEFQEYFTEDDRIAQGAALLLDRIVRQGRAFGIHVLLGSQTLGGAYTLARTTLGQMVVRIALQCNEADAYLIMDENNPAPRLLSRPGEGIYNDAAGAVEGNSPFQVVWLSDDEREQHLKRIRQRADEIGETASGPIVFEGNAPSNIRENAELRLLLSSSEIKPVPAARAFLGAPNSIKGPTEVLFHRQSGNNLLVLGQRDEATLAMLGVTLISLAAQHRKGTANFIVFDASPPGSPAREFLERVVQSLPHDVILAKPTEVATVMAELAPELDRRADPSAGGEHPTIYVIVLGLPRFRGLKQEDEFSMSLDAAAGPQPGAVFTRLLSEGPSLGCHVICTCDTLNNLNRFVSRKMITEFERRVLFQMSDNDSATLIDSSAAGSLGLHRALLYNAQEGSTETFRPYALPDNTWLDESGQALKRLVG